MATGPSGSSIPIPPQYVQYLPPASSAAPSQSASSPSTGGQQHYHPNAGPSIYHTQGYGRQQPHPQTQQQQFHLLPPTTGHTQHFQPPGPPGPSATALPSLAGYVKGNSNNNQNAFVTYKEVNPLRVSILRNCKTVVVIVHINFTP